jgi:DtxR family transcriptional regulator, Mn-dependent transcriptional regulator
MVVTVGLDPRNLSPRTRKGRDVGDLIDTTEMYLRTIFELDEEGIVPLRARIAEQLSHSGPTVSQTIARMERDGLVVVSDNRHLELTEAGRARATRVMRKHRLAERLLIDVIGLDWSLVHDEACRWEHVMSEHVERRLVELLDHPHRSPYGNPIPGLDEFGDHTGVEFLDGVVPLVDVDDAATVTVTQLGESLQADPSMLAEFDAAGVRPGAQVVVRVLDGDIRLEAAGQALDLSESVARHVYVQL